MLSILLYLYCNCAIWKAFFLSICYDQQKVFFAIKSKRRLLSRVSAPNEKLVCRKICSTVCPSSSSKSPSELGLGLIQWHFFPFKTKPEILQPPCSEFEWDFIVVSSIDTSAICRAIP